MTNLEWLKNNDDLLEKYLCLGLAVHRETGRVSKCGGDVRCDNCLFDARYRGSSCGESRKEWLNKEHDPLFKRGDIVVFKPSKFYPAETRIGVVSKDDCDGTVLLTWNISNIERHLDVVDDIDAIQCNIEDIVRKIGNILEVK